jgi:hypothetical protein
LIGEAAERTGISIHSILRRNFPSSTMLQISESDFDCVIVTDKTKVSIITAFADEIYKMPFSKEYPLFMPIL